MAEQLYDVLLGPGVRRGLETGLAPLGDVRGWVAVLCGLHDIGKCTPIFQAMRSDIAVACFGESVRGELDRVEPAAHRHGVKTMHGLLTAVYFRRALDAWGASVSARDAISYGLGGHHGSLLDAMSVQEAARLEGHNGTARWGHWRDELVSAVLSLWGLGDPARQAWAGVSLDVPAMVGLAGLASVSDWIASDTTNFPYAAPPPDDLSVYLDQARAQAQVAVRDRLRWRPWVPPQDTRFRVLFPEDGDPRPLQVAVEELVANRDVPGVLVVEAPTGEGKTKAALQAAAALVRRLDLSGAYVAMPTQATANQVYAELTAHADRLGFDGPPNLAHSAAGRHLAFVAQQESAKPSEVGVDDGGASQTDARDWFTRKRGLLFPVGVSTIDQALQAATRSWHVFVRMTALSSKVLVVDEVHAVDTFMSTVLKRLMWWCGRLGMPVVLLSATLPADQRESLIANWRAGSRALPPSAVAPAPAEPAGGWQITWADAADRVSRPIDISSVNADRDVTLDHIDDEELTAWLRRRLETSGCALVIHNLVSRAMNTFDRLKQETATWTNPPNLVYLTGHVPEGDRRKIERQLREDFGPTARQRPHAIVVGTQVLQHSLDLDFDVLASDLCPIDVLIQRIGRVHRHERPEETRGWPTPAVSLVGPGEQDDGPRLPRGVHTVYPTALLLATWHLIRHRTVLRLPSETSKLVHKVYVESDLVATAAQQRRWDNANRTMRRQHSNDEYDGRTRYLPPLGASDSIRRLTARPVSAKQTRKESYPKKEQR